MPQIGAVFTTLHIHNLRIGPISEGARLHQAGYACQGQTLKLIGLIHKLLRN